VRESRRPAGASAAPGKTQSGASSSPAHSLEPAAPAAAAAEGSSPVAVLPAAPDPNEFLVFFTVKSAEIPIYAQETLTGVARRLAESPRSAAVIEGHTDAVGDPAFNQAISESRAAVVKEFLIEKGIASARLSALGMGSAKPLETNDTPQGRIRNRRVVVRLTDER
jgi:OOP family OmpA-OmpF porin